MIETQRDRFTTISAEKLKARRYYPEIYTKTHTKAEKETFASKFKINKQLFETTLSAGATFSCQSGFIAGGCSNGHKFLKAVFCGREYCDTCGADGSPSHLRRIARWIPKAEQITNMAYLVITIPEQARAHFKNKTALTEFRTFVKRKLQRDGITRGLIRWHWFGDCRQCKGAGCFHCHNSGMSKKFHPHLNILIDGGLMKKREFNRFTQNWRNSLTSYFEKVTGIEKLPANLHYQYTNKPEIRAHWLKYVTRATHRNYNKEIAEKLAGYRTTATFGTWNHKIKVKTEISDAVALEASACPCCGSRVTWDVGSYETDLITGEIKYKRKILKVHQIRDPDKVSHLTAGYYIIKN